LFTEWDVFLDYRATELQELGVPSSAAYDLSKVVQTLTPGTIETSTDPLLKDTSVPKVTSGQKKEFKTVNLVFENGDRENLTSLKAGSLNDIKNWITNEKMKKSLIEPKFSYWDKETKEWKEITEKTDISSLPDPLKISIESATSTGA